MNVFVTGAAGYIGGSVAHRLVQAGHRVRGLVRHSVRADALSTFGVTPVVGALDDGDLLAREARAADAVVNAADSRHRAGLEALIGGLLGSGKPLVHTSGVGMVSRDVQGDATAQEAIDDTSPVEPGPHPAQASLHAQERRVLEASDAGIRGIVLSNSLLYGDPLGPQAESVQLPIMVRQAREDAQARFVGRGVNRWSNAHVADAAALYVLALESAPAGAFYFVENGEASFAEVASAIARGLGLGPARSWTLEEAAARLGEGAARFLLGSDARVRALRARSELGWAPRHGSAGEWIKGALAREEGGA
ncbi:NAD-dependent epimerase/dehydratase family protein [uncultured Enterovirga sp.]|uniref:NAD-dependent epimerase/dehydratase family protein n=1 Tax=uncultured Enterovirga sp. TaxID=2026352 RepID=UPI0035CC9D65